MKYVFEPTKYGFLPPKRMPPQLKDFLNTNSFIKIIHQVLGGSFWYQSCHAMGKTDDRWCFTGGLYSTYMGIRHTAHQDYLGCITSEKFAQVLLVHMFGTTTNKGTLKYGQQRLKAASVKLEF